MSLKGEDWSKGAIPVLGSTLSSIRPVAKAMERQRPSSQRRGVIRAHHFQSLFLIACESELTPHAFEYYNAFAIKTGGKRDEDDH
jgi:hypothetical protein